MKLLFFLMLIIAGCKTVKPVQKMYVPDDKQLYETILQMDSIYFHAYNTCDMATQEKIYSDSLEFYHDNGGLTTSKQEVMDGIRKYICNKVSRELVQGSVEVYPIKGYGAVEVGYHKFHNLVENSISSPGRFVIVWKQKNNSWQITRVISTH